MKAASVVLVALVLSLAVPTDAVAGGRTCSEVFERQAENWAELTARTAELARATDGARTAELSDVIAELRDVEARLWHDHRSQSCNQHAAGHGYDDPILQLNTAGGVQVTLLRLQLERQAAFDALTAAFVAGLPFESLLARVQSLDYASRNARARQTMLLSDRSRPYQVAVDPFYRPTDLDTARADELRMKIRELIWVISQHEASGKDTTTLEQTLAAVRYLLEHAEQSPGSP